MATQRQELPEPPKRKGTNYLRAASALFFATFAAKKHDGQDDPYFFFRDVCEALGPEPGKLIHILRAMFYSCVPLYILFFLLNLVIAWKADAETARSFQQGFYVIEPILRVVLFCTIFNPFWHVKNEPGHIITVSVGAKQLMQIYFHDGDAQIFPILGERAYSHALEVGTITTVLRGKVELPYWDEETKSEDFVTMTGPDGAPIECPNEPVLTDPFRNVRLLQQAGIDGVAKKYHDTTSSHVILAPSKAAELRKKAGKQVRLNELMSATTGQELFEDGLQALQDDEDVKRSYVIWLNGRQENVIDTGTGYVLKDIHTQGITPDPQVIDSFNKRRATITEAKAKATAREIEAGGEAKAKVIETEGEAKAYEQAMLIIRKYGSGGLPEGQAAMILTGALKGEEVKITRFGIDIGGGGKMENILDKLEGKGFTPEWFERVFGHVAATVGAMAGSGSKGKSTDKGADKKEAPKKGGKP